MSKGSKRGTRVGDDTGANRHMDEISIDATVLVP